MSSTAPSRAHLGDVIVLISKADLTERQNQDLRSAVRTVAKVLGAEPEAIAADPALLRRRLEGISPEAFGLSRGRWANIRSLLGKALPWYVRCCPVGVSNRCFPNGKPSLRGLRFTAVLAFSRCCGS